jgi:hypothetical protein
VNSLLEVANGNLATSEQQNGMLSNTLNFLQTRLESVQNTLLVVRRENVSLNQQLRNEFGELNRTNDTIEITTQAVRVLSRKVNEILSAIRNNQDVSQSLADAQALLNDSPVLSLLNRISQYSNLDITAVTLIRTQALENQDQILVLASEDTLGQILEGLSAIHGFMLENPHVVESLV